MARISVKFVLLALLLCLVALTLADEHDHDHTTTSDHDDHDHDDHDDHDHDDHDHDDHAHEEGSASTYEIWAAFGITCFAGCAAFIGSLSMFCIKREQIGAISIALAFAGAIVVYLAFMALIPECIAELSHSIEHADENEGLIRFYTLLCVAGGVAIAALMEYLFEKFGVHNHDHEHDHAEEDGPPPPTPRRVRTRSLPSECAKGACDHDRHMENSPDFASDGTATPNVETPNDVATVSPSVDVANTENRTTTGGDVDADVSRVSYAVAFALILHHFPEGIATFISLYYDFEFGVLVAFALAIHDIPAGVCIAVTTYVATGSRRKPLLLCLIAALAYPLGALVGLLVIETAEQSTVDAFVGALFGVTGGIMLYIAFVELLPSAIMSAKDAAKKGHKKVYGYSLAAIFVGFLVMDVSSIILAVTGGHSH